MTAALAGLGLGAIGSLFGGGGRDRDRGFSRFEEENTQRAQRALRSSERLGGRAENEFFQRSLGFDAQAAAERSAMGIAGSLSGQLGRNLELARGQAVGSGRLETGFFDEDRGRIFEDFNERLTNAIAQQALQAQSLNLQNLGQIGQFGQNVQNRFVNLLGGSLDRATAEENARRQQGGGLFGQLLGGVIGAAAPGIGSTIGGAIGSGISGLFGGGGDGGGGANPSRADQKREKARQATKGFK